MRGDILNQILALKEMKSEDLLTKYLEVFGGQRPKINNTEYLCKKNSQVSKAIFFNFFSKICIKANNFS